MAMKLHVYGTQSRMYMYVCMIQTNADFIFQKLILFQGRIRFFFSKAWNLGAALMPPLGPGQRLGGGPRGEAPGGS